MTPARHTVVVAGNGMVGLRFCRELTDRAPGRFEVIAVGEEDQPAYDRVHLSAVLRGRRVDDLVIEPRAWYQARGVELVLGDPIASIDRRRTSVRTRRGRELLYDTLVLATGAGPTRPPIPGSDLPGVLAYRSATDLLAVKLAAARSTSAAVLGGGLIGVEVAAALVELGLETTLVESGPHLLHRQIDRLASEIVCAEIERAGVHVAAGARVRAIRVRPGGLAVELERDAALAVDLVVLAAGVRPRDELARAADLAVDEQRGGVLVDDDLATADPRILAIGDCARHEGVNHGHVAPGYRMAEIAARRVAGEIVRYTGADASIHLSVAGVEVAALGDHGGGGRRLVFHDGAIRRTLVLRDGRIAGVSAVGPWASLAAVEEILRSERRLSSTEIARFCTTGDPCPASRRPTRADAAILCTCAQVSCGAVRTAVARGCGSLASIAAATGAGASCGACRPALVQLLVGGDRGGTTAPPPMAEPRGRWPMIAVSLVALAAAAAFAIAGRAVAAAGVDAARWLADLPGSSSKVTSGFVLVGASALGLLLSFRKRLPRWRRRGPMPWFRVLHGAIGVAAVGLLVGHTGMRMGDNLNRALLVAFLGVVASGATVGIAAAATSRAHASPHVVARARTALLWGHFLFLWVLPVLVTFHVIAVYYF